MDQNSSLEPQNCNSKAISPPNPAQLIQKERNNLTFDVQTLEHILDGGKKVTEGKRQMGKLIENDPVLRCDRVEWLEMTRPQLRQRTMAKLKRAVELRKNFSPEQHDYFAEVMAQYDQSWGMRYGVHTALFYPTIKSQGSDEQIKYWESDIINHRILGCFGMTELGNGSFIQNFETQAIYDQSSDTFLIHSPTITSYKWWIGMASETATHCAVYARLIVKNEDHGIHVFVVPLRDRDTGRLLPGVQTGDVGFKMGRNGLDNGYICFNKVRIPRTNMLMRYATLDSNGNYTPSPLAQLAYGALVGGRVKMCLFGKNNLKHALTIAIRYSIGRVHYGTQQLLDYHTHQYRLLNILSSLYAIHFGSAVLGQRYDSMMKELLTNQDMTNLAEVHGLSSAMKAFVTWFVLDSIEVCRQCCGGHGYSAYAAFTSLFNDFGVLVSGEGDNTVIAYTQTGRYLMNAVKKILKGENMTADSLLYLNEINKYTTSRNLNDLLNLRPQVASVKDAKELLNGSNLLDLCKWTSIKVLLQTHLQMSQDLTKGKSQTEVINDHSVRLVHCAKTYCYVFLAQQFQNAIESLNNGSSPSVAGLDARSVKGVVPVLKNLHEVFMLNYLESNLATCYEAGIISLEVGREIHSVSASSLKNIRKNAVGLVDAFGIPDFVVDSPLGFYDGNIYENYLKMVNRAPQQSPTPYWPTLIKPLLNSKL